MSNLHGQVPLVLTQLCITSALVGFSLRRSNSSSERALTSKQDTFGVIKTREELRDGCPTDLQHVFWRKVRNLYIVFYPDLDIRKIGIHEKDRVSHPSSRNYSHLVLSTSSFMFVGSNM